MSTTNREPRTLNRANRRIGETANRRNSEPVKGEPRKSTLCDAASGRQPCQRRQLLRPGRRCRRWQQPQQRGAARRVRLRCWHWQRQSWSSVGRSKATSTADSCTSHGITLALPACIQQRSDASRSTCSKANTGCGRSLPSCRAQGDGGTRTGCPQRRVQPLNEIERKHRNVAGHGGQQGRATGLQRSQHAGQRAPECCRRGSGASAASDAAAIADNQVGAAVAVVGHHRPAPAAVGWQMAVGVDDQCLHLGRKPPGRVQRQWRTVPIHQPLVGACHALAAPAGEHASGDFQASAARSWRRRQRLAHQPPM